MRLVVAQRLRLLLVVTGAALGALAAPARAQDDDGFGGASSPSSSTSASTGGDAAPLGDDDVCTVKGDDGVWRACADVLAAKAAAEAARAGGASEAPPRDDSPAAQALRERMKAADEAARAPVPKTQLEIDLEKAHLDPTMPLLALRVDVARAQDAVTRLEKQGTGGRAKDEAEAALAQANLVLDAVERVAIHRMDVCAQRRGNKPIVKNFRMTAAGPVLLTTRELIARLPIVDPSGCERVILVDEAIVAKVKRAFELRHVLATTEFGYHEVARRRELEKELAAVEKSLANEAIPAMSAPGVRDPYGSR